jgi:hypothetical protein
MEDFMGKSMEKSYVNGEIWENMRKYGETTWENMEKNLGRYGKT